MLLLLKAIVPLLLSHPLAGANDARLTVCGTSEFIVGDNESTLRKMMVRELCTVLQLHGLLQTVKPVIAAHRLVLHIFYQGNASP